MTYISYLYIYTCTYVSVYIYHISMFLSCTDTSMHVNISSVIYHLFIFIYNLSIVLSVIYLSIVYSIIYLPFTIYQLPSIINLSSIINQSIFYHLFIIYLYLCLSLINLFPFICLPVYHLLLINIFSKYL